MAEGLEEFGLGNRIPRASDGREPLDWFRITLDQVDQQRGLRIRLGSCVWINTTRR